MKRRLREGGREGGYGGARKKERKKRKEKMTEARAQRSVGFSGVPNRYILKFKGHMKVDFIKKSKKRKKRQTRMGSIKVLIR